MITEWEGCIDGIFEGYEQGRVYQLSDGRRWKQSCRTSEYVYREQPQARLLWNQSLGIRYLDVEGTSNAVTVVSDLGRGMSGVGAY